jgi:HSP20 family protein
MSITKRTRSEFEWPDWLPTRRLFEFPALREFMDEEHFRVEEFQEDGTCVIKAEVPGIDPDKDVEITVADRTLTIKVERRQESETEDKKGFRSEFRYGSFVRTMTLPLGATDKDVTATYADGILEVRVPISAEQAAARKVPVTRS